MNRQDTLHRAAQAVMIDRAATHGDMEDSFDRIAALWTVLIGVGISPAQVALMMIAFKSVRAWDNPRHDDNFVDLAGYAACGAELVR